MTNVNPFKSDQTVAIPKHYWNMFLMNTWVHFSLDTSISLTMKLTNHEPNSVF